MRPSEIAVYILGAPIMMINVWTSQSFWLATLNFTVLISFVCIGLYDFYLHWASLDEWD